MDDIASLRSKIVFSYNFDLKAWKDVGGVIQEGDLVLRYISGVVSKFPRNIGEGIAVVIDPGCGAAYRTTAEILRALGCKIFTINAYPDGTFPARDPEPSVEGLAPLADMVVSTVLLLGCLMGMRIGRYLLMIKVVLLKKIRNLPLLRSTFVHKRKVY
jgi:phosphomannomutase